MWINSDVLLSAGLGSMIGIAVALLLVKVIGPLLLVAGIMVVDLVEDAIARIRVARKHADRDSE